jgi:hypothetical protein
MFSGSDDGTGLILVGGSGKKLLRPGIYIYIPWEGVAYTRSGNGGWAAGKNVRERRVRIKLTVERRTDGVDGKGSKLARWRSPFSAFSTAWKINKIMPKRSKKGNRFETPITCLSSA